MLVVIIGFVIFILFYYAMFWFVLSNERIRRRGKIFRCTVYTLCCVWGLLFFDRYILVVRRINTNDYEDYSFWGIFYDIFDVLIFAFMMSVLFALAVYMYDRYVK